MKDFDTNAWALSHKIAESLGNELVSNDIDKTLVKLYLTIIDEQVDQDLYYNNFIFANKFIDTLMYHAVDICHMYDPFSAFPFPEYVDGEFNFTSYKVKFKIAFYDYFSFYVNVKDDVIYVTASFGGVCKREVIHNHILSEHTDYIKIYISNFFYSLDRTLYKIYDNVYNNGIKPEKYSEHEGFYTLMMKKKYLDNIDDQVSGEAALWCYYHFDTELKINAIKNKLKAL